MREELQVPGQPVVEWSACAPSKATTQSPELPQHAHVQARCRVRPVPTAAVVNDDRVPPASMVLSKDCAPNSAPHRVPRASTAQKGPPTRSSAGRQISTVRSDRRNRRQCLEVSSR
ncbi:hypothetical protein PF005_g16505 [Phytophthora fragariae]|uniref:Uncharacterized protein n=2 Tax=Phytophthora TaxID=4783 RepID=A0A6A3XF68_9STRA|nr:hypothetical protein PF009_g17727 [Phytophthora fragariae]KAE9038126.1 hypothetical protein PR002_g6193 [Phytophthora rubi]KAE9078252.1 hypothetical protein PF007_g23936 [Phytophthora fragariae]KAE9132425.1 hypothetical protein PF006_g15287 [Phytophthora fragariae]KAE9197452.1 hypothetical protein PF005_g16505 [Phytophthora fragariae]